MTRGYEKLAHAIVMQAVRDWRAAKRKLKKKSINDNAKLELEECEKFFLSDYFMILMELDGKVLIRKLYEEDGR